MEIPNTFRKNGFTYILYKAGVKACIFEQLYSQKPKVSYFEVISLINEKGEERMRKGGERFGKVYEDSFPIPENEAFGKWAWSFRSKEKAIECFNKLEK